MNNFRITVKIGSNVLTRKDGTLDVTRMSALVDQVAELYRRGIQVILVSSGAVASGRSEMKVRANGQRTADGGQPSAGSSQRTLDAVSQRQLYSAVGQAKLINKYYELFRDHGIPCGQVLTTKESFGSRGHYLNQKNCMEVMLQEGVIPIVNENDTISVTELMFTDNDELSGLIATMMNAQLLILLSNIDGIYTGNPSDPESQLIPIISDDTDISGYIQTNRSSFGRGGMVTKHRIARKVAGEGIEVIISNGKREGILVDLIDAEFTMHNARLDASDDEGNNRESCITNHEPNHWPRCTRFLADKKETSSVKKWIAHSEGFSKGAIYINEGAAIAVLGERAASILPVGVTRVEGDFEEDDIVAIYHDDKRLGVGRVSCSSAEAREVMGKKGQRPLVHYDYLALDNE